MSLEFLVRFRRATSLAFAMVAYSATLASAAPDPSKLDPLVASVTAITSGEKYSGVPEPLNIANRAKYIQPWSGFCPKASADSAVAKNLPCMTFNLKNPDYYGIEVGTNKWLDLACDLSTQSVRAGMEPFGTVIVQVDDETGNVIRYWQAVNRVEDQSDPTSHAEVNAIRGACRDLGVVSLSSIAKERARMPQTGKTSHCELYTSHESCAMCYAAIRQAHIPVLVFASTLWDGQVQGLPYRGDLLYSEMSKPVNKRSGADFHVYQGSSPKSVDSLNLFNVMTH